MTGMHPKTWLRLMFKAIGVFILVLRAPDFLIEVIYRLSYPGENGAWSFTSAYAPMQTWAPTAPTPVSDLLVGIFFHFGSQFLSFAIALYLIFGGEWLVNLLLPPDRSRCPECGYELASKNIARCSECGEVLKKPAPEESSAS